MEDNRDLIGMIKVNLEQAEFMNAETFDKWVTGEQLLSQKCEALPCLVEPIMHKVGLACLAGASDTGKSAFLRQLCYAVASGADHFLDFPLNARHHSAIYVSTEDDAMAMNWVFNKQNEDWKTTPEELKGLRVLFDTTDLLRELDEKLTEAPADIVCIDAFTDLFSGELNKSNEVRCFLNNYSQLAQRHQCLVMFLHHCGKRTEQEKTPSKHNLLGSQAFEAKMRLVLELRSDTENPNLKHLCVVKGNYLSATHKSESFDLWFSDNLTFSDTKGRTPFEQLVKTPADKAAKEESMRERKAMAREFHEQGMTLQQIAEAMNVNKSTVSRWLNYAKAVETEVALHGIF